MPKPSPKALLKTAANYLKDHPEEILRTVKDAFGLRVGIPLDALRHLAGEFGGGKKAPKDVVIEAVPPGLRIAMTVKAMGTTLRVKLTVFVEDLSIVASEARVTARIKDMSLEVLDGEDTPVAGLIKSGALDLSKPGNLVAYMPKRPEALVDAKDDVVVIDLLRVPSLAKNKKFRRGLNVVTPVVTVSRIDTRHDHLYLQFRATPSGLSEAIAAAQSAA
jgi:hypothetical protein